MEAEEKLEQLKATKEKNSVETDDPERKGRCWVQGMLET
jgi:hypothetical protein